VTQPDDTGGGEGEPQRPDSAEDANLTDQIQLTATVTPRCTVIPRV
jgi:hypothetical protein